MGTHIRRREDHTVSSFLRRTVSAQLHLLGTLAAIAGLWVLYRVVAQSEDAGKIWACMAFSLTSILVFAVSTTYHFLDDGFHLTPRLKLHLENLDHVAIYLFIAGTYSPFLLAAVAPPWDVILLVAIWSIAVLGILYTLLKPRLPLWAQHRILYTSIFLAMGWTLLIRAQEVFAFLPKMGVVLLAAGAFFYSIGAVVYALKRPNFFHGVFGFHELWHVFVLLGFGSHYFLILSLYSAQTKA